MIHPSHGHLHPSQGYTHRFISNDTPISWASFPHKGTQHSISVLERNDTPISWAHPTRGLSHKPTHSVYVLEDVSKSCNHQHSLSAREAFSTRPSLTKVLDLRLGKRFGEDICNMLMCRKVLHMYSFPLHHVSDIMIFYLNVFQSIVKHRVLR
jgi:hypothetical protein